MPHRIVEKCKLAGECKKVCPVDAIAEGNPMFVIDASVCIDCGACKAVCPHDAIVVE